MADHLSPRQRSDNMRKIRSKNTRPEVLLRSKLHKLGYRFRLHDSSLPGKPDIVLKRHNLVIFCHGCFWHQHSDCKRATAPKSNTAYWIPKLERNQSRFHEAKNELVELGWSVIVFWECEIMGGDLSEKIIRVRLDS